MGSKNIENSFVGKAIGEELKHLDRKATASWEELLPRLQDHVSVTQHPLTGFTVFWLRNKKVIWALLAVLVFAIGLYFIADRPRNKPDAAAPTTVQPAHVEEKTVAPEQKSNSAAQRDSVTAPTPVATEPKTLTPAAAPSGTAARATVPTAASTVPPVAATAAPVKAITTAKLVAPAAAPAAKPAAPHVSSPVEPVKKDTPLQHAAPPATNPSHVFPVLKDSVPD